VGIVGPAAWRSKGDKEQMPGQALFSRVAHNPSLNGWRADNRQLLVFHTFKDFRMSASSMFRRFAAATSTAAGKPAVFILAVLMIVIWAASGPIFHFGDTWQLVINTSTTIITFLMVFLIQNTQNRDGAAIQIKLDELIRSSRAHNALLDLEELDDTTLTRIRLHYCHLAEKGRSELDNLEEALTADPD
jgi:low affinity Fe/Cu permease